LTCQRKGKEQEKNQNAPKAFTPPTSGLNIDLGGWINNAKILVPMTKILKIPSQKSKLLKAMDAPHGKEMSNFSKDGFEDATVIFQCSNMCRGNKDH